MHSQRSIVYFNSGAIGEFLMTLYFADLVTKGTDTRVYVPVRRNGVALLELASAYPQVRVIPLDDMHFVQGLREILLIPGVRSVLTQQTFGRHAFSLVLLARITAWLGRGGSKLVGFADGSWYGRMLSDKQWDFDYHMLFPVAMQVLATQLGYAVMTEPVSLRLKKTDTLAHNIGPYVVFHLNAFTPMRTPTREGWRQLISGARGEFPTMKFLFSGSDQDIPLIDACIEGIPDCENIAGSNTLPELAHLIASASAYVGPDTGITHLAAFVNTPSVIWGTRSTPCWWATYSTAVQWLTEPKHCACTLVKNGECRAEAEGALRFRCMLEVPIESLLNALIGVVRMQDDMLGATS